MPKLHRYRHEASFANLSRGKSKAISSVTTEQKALDSQIADSIWIGLTKQSISGWGLWIGQETDRCCNAEKQSDQNYPKSGLFISVYISLFFPDFSKGKWVGCNKTVAGKRSLRICCFRKNVGAGQGNNEGRE